MINWMQKHNKYLIPTVWISGLAFVGAGFVGWGAYDMNKDKTSSVAKVGDTSVSIQEFQNKYRNVFNYYNALSQGKLTEEKADEMNLKNVALYYTIQETMLYNYAKDLGLRTTNQDIEQYILKNPEFQKNGKFNRGIYQQLLQSVGTTPKDYEESLKKTILIDKLNEALSIPVKDEDKSLLASAYFMQDKLSLKVINVDDRNISINNDELKTFWNKNKNNYITKKSYLLNTHFIKPENIKVDEKTLMDLYENNKESYRNDKDEILNFKDAKDEVYKNYIQNLSKEMALKEFLAIKKKEKAAETKMQIEDGDTKFPIDKIQNKKEGEVLKPFEFNDGSLIVQIDKIIEPRVMTFDEAKNFVTDDFKKEKSKEILKNKADSELKNFSGTDIGFVTKNETKSIAGLDKNQSKTFLSTIFQSKNPSGYVLFDSKIVVYKILDQNLTNNDELKKNDNFIANNILSIKDSQLKQDLIKELEKRYKIIQYYKGSKN